jgi:hypothetical protein
LTGQSTHKVTYRQQTKLPLLIGLSMDAWGELTFDNDTANDWACGLEAIEDAVSTSTLNSP